MPDDNSLADSYRAWRRSALGRITDELEWRLLLDLAGSVDGKRVLDAGCGDGAFAAALAARGAWVVGVDRDPDMIVAAQDASASSSVPFRIVGADAASAPFREASFNVVFASTLLCLADKREAILAELARVTATDGVVVIGDLGRCSLWNFLRRRRGRRGDRTWSRAHFWTPHDLSDAISNAGLTPGPIRGSVFYPPIPQIAGIMAPFDAALGRMTTLGASFLAVACRKRASAAAPAEVPLGSGFTPRR